jgi:citrate/tricarballylate utilization protein
MPASDARAEAARLMGICNACRYCEGYCAVFPAMERRIDFGCAEVAYLASLCHGCGACHSACQYAPPHEFAVNIPRTFAEVRVASYEECAWPPAFAGLFRHHPLLVGVASALATALFLALGAAAGGGLFAQRGGAFYAIFPHGLLVTVFGLAFGYAVLALAMGALRYSRLVRDSTGLSPQGADALRAAGDALTLRYLDGGGEGCYEGRGEPAKARRLFHHCTFYGFALCFAATSVATIYHYALGLSAPYALTSLPVVLGTLGGIGLLVGPLGLLWLDGRRDAELADAGQRAMQRSFIAMLLLVSATGLALLALRDTALMGPLFAVHLGFVLAFFVTLPYGKFVHGIYRAQALVKFARESRAPNTAGIAES